MGYTFDGTMDDTLDGMDSMDKKLCDICQHDIPVDDRSPDGLMRYLYVWDLFKKASDYLGTKIDWVH